MATRTEENVEEFVAEMLESIDEQIKAIDSSKVVQAAEKLLAKKTTLMAARRALLGGNSMTGGSSGTRITREDVVRVMPPAGGATPVWLAEKLHTTEAVVRGHLNRGKDERFLKLNNYWYLRDPEKGIDTIADLVED